MERLDGRRGGGTLKVDVIVTWGDDSVLPPTLDELVVWAERGPGDVSVADGVVTIEEASRDPSNGHHDHDGERIDRRGGTPAGVLVLWWRQVVPDEVEPRVMFFAPPVL